MKIMQLLLFLFSLLVSPLLYAEECNELAPSFMVNGVEKWRGLSVTEVYKQHNATNSLEHSKDSSKGVSLKSLISPYAKDGTLIVYACGGKSRSFEVADLLSGASEKPDYYLVMTKKKFFKLVDAQNSKPILKRVHLLKLLN